MLELRSLRKKYGTQVAVDEVTFAVNEGECVGLLGPNGAGKTTTVSMIAGLLKPDSGEVLFDGRPIQADSDPRKGQLGLVPQELALYEELSARDNLSFFAALYGLSGKACAQRVASSLATVGLADRAADKARSFSGGMKRRLNLAAALLSQPRLLLLDEPTVGIDPQSRNAIFDNLEALRRQGVGLLYTTHYMEEAERLCDRIVIIDQGKVIASDTLRGLHKRVPTQNTLRVELEGPSADGLVAAVRGLPGVLKADCTGESLTVGLTGLDKAPAVLAWLSAQGQSYGHFVTERPSLEHVFLTLTGRSLRDP